MPFPASAQALGHVVQSSDAQNVETYVVPAGTAGYHLGLGLNPPQPPDWINVADGAFPVLPPGAPTTGPGTGFTNGQLTPNTSYMWAMSNVTDYGETPVGVALTVPSDGNFTGYVLALPPVAEGTTDNPIRRRRLYRTAAGGAAPFKYVGELADLSLTTWRDGLPDSELGDSAPTTSTSGVTGIVILSGGGVQVWTERGPTTIQQNLQSGDFVVNRQTGNIVHATADANRASVTVRWSGATLDTASLVNDHIGAVRDVATAAGQPGGLATIDANGRAVQPPPTGFYRNVGYQQNTTHMYFGGAPAGGTYPWAALSNNTNFPALNATTRGGVLRLSLNGHVGPTFGNAGDNAQAQWRVNIDNGARYAYLGMVEALCRQAASDLGLTTYLAGLAAGAHTVLLECQTAGASTMQWQCLTDSTPGTDQLVFSIDEF